MKKIFIFLFLLVLIIFSITVLRTLGGQITTGENLDRVTYCQKIGHYWLGQCLNGDYLTGDNQVHDPEGRYLMTYGSLGKRMSLRGWVKENLLKEKNGCPIGEAQEICDGPMIID